MTSNFKLLPKNWSGYKDTTLVIVPGLLQVEFNYTLHFSGIVDFDEKNFTAAGCNAVFTNLSDSVSLEDMDITVDIPDLAPNWKCAIVSGRHEPAIIENFTYPLKQLAPNEKSATMSFHWTPYTDTNTPMKESEPFQYNIIASFTTNTQNASASIEGTINCT